MVQAGEELYKLEKELGEYAGPDRIISSREFWEIESKKPRSEHVFKTGIKRLDTLTEGVESGELVVVSGPTGNGKTLLCDTVGREITKAGGKVLWFSFEVTPKKFLEKYRSAGSPIIYLPAEMQAGNIRWLASKVHEAKVKHNCRAVFIDHLHFVVDLIQNKNPSWEIGKIMRLLKTEIALRHNMAVFLISHMTKLKFEEEPNVNDLRDSSFIAQEADQVWIVYRITDKGKKETDPDAFSNRALLVVGKSRRTGVLKAKVNLVKVGDSLVEEEFNDYPTL